MQRLHNSRNQAIAHLKGIAVSTYFCSLLSTIKGALNPNFLNLTINREKLKKSKVLAGSRVIAQF